jgi:hypothetical protein
LVLVAVLAALVILGLRHTPKPASPVARHPATRHAPSVVRHRPRPAPTTVTVALVPTGRVYVCMVDGGGRRLIPGQIFDVGERVPVQRSSRILMTLGNNAVHVTANGRTVPIAPATGAIGVEFTPHGSRTLAPHELPTCT